MKLSSIFSTRNVTLVVFILVVLFLGTAFSVKVGPEPMTMTTPYSDNKKNKKNEPKLKTMSTPVLMK